MKEVPATEAKAHLARLLGDVERGEAITITRHGKAIARLVPVETDAAAQRREAVEALRRWRRTLPPSDLTIVDILSARDEGRK
ncbi:MAG: type II toxin-antitoxin system prevent-host-death family antitoxin [Rhodospirillaceae bacterium]|nr:type II toxin-antitoxin system prevent-host-death family antitoxin [Rhodospirillaceae bacterium]